MPILSNKFEPTDRINQRQLLSSPLQSILSLKSSAQALPGLLFPNLKYQTIHLEANHVLHNWTTPNAQPSNAQQLAISGSVLTHRMKVPPLFTTPWLPWGFSSPITHTSTHRWLAMASTHIALSRRMTSFSIAHVRITKAASDTLSCVSIRLESPEACFGRNSCLRVEMLILSLDQGH